MAPATKTVHSTIKFFFFWIYNNTDRLRSILSKGKISGGLHAASIGRRYRPKATVLQLQQISAAQQHGLGSQEPQLQRQQINALNAASGMPGIAPHTAAQQQGPDISRQAPLLQQQWDHPKNAHLGSVSISPKSRSHVWWTCDKCPLGLAHGWLATVNSRGCTQQSGCPYCADRSVCAHNSLAAQAPTVAAQ